MTKKLHRLLLLFILLLSFMLSGCKEQIHNESLSENTSAAISVVVKDLTPPTIECKDTFTVTAGSSFDLRDHIKVSDNIDNDLTYECIGSYHTDSAGQYIIQIKAADRAGNQASKNVSVYVKAAPSAPHDNNQNTPQEHTPVKPRAEIHSQDFLYSSGYDMDTASQACSTALHASGKSGSCDPLQNDDGIYIGMRLQIYE